ncbi:NAD-dependent epimerase/dehydratase family protein [Chloroflexota bacterium]
MTSEYHCRVFREVYGLVIACLKYFDVYGPRQTPNSQYAVVIPIFISRVFMGMFLEKGLIEV